MAVVFCQQLGAKELILTHFSQRYKRLGDILEPGDDTTDKLVSEARETINNLTGHCPSGSGGLSTVAAGAGESSEYSHHGTHNYSCTVSAADDFKTYTIPARKQ